jgi:hypothetical protein
MAMGGNLVGAGGEMVMLAGTPSGAPSSILSLVVVTLTIAGLVGLSRLRLPQQLV